MTASFRHLALVVPDLRAAEAYYRAVFGMDLIGREARLGDGLWYTLPPDKGWEDADAAGVDLGMVALRTDGVVLALFKGDASPGQVYVVGLTMSPEEIVDVRARLPEAAEVRRSAPDYLEFHDPYQITWQISAPGSEFRSSGPAAGRWLQL